MKIDPEERFTHRVESYLRYRPSYPSRLLDLLEDRCNLQSSSVLADIGSGTGILSRLWLARGYRVHGIEPNAAMRAAAEQRLRHEGFFSCDGTAEATTLERASIDLVCVAQAFHWFDRTAARREFERILQPAGWVAIIWNDRRKSATPFLAAYEQLLCDHGTDYEEVDHSRVTESDLQVFFGPGGCEAVQFDNGQSLDFDALRGRLESSSYAPAPGTPGHGPMIDALHQIFDAHQTEGAVRLEYDTVAYYGRLS